MRVLSTLPIVVFLLVLLALSSFARNGETCHAGSGQFDHKFAPYSLHVGPVSGEYEERMCRAVLRSSDGREVFTASDVGITLNPISGASVTNDGVRSLVLEGFSGGAHCCWTYWIVSLGQSPGLVREIRNQTGMAFERQHNSNVVMRTGDGAFDYFDDLPHADAPMPTVYLQLQGRALKDVSAQFASEYDAAIAETRRLLTADRIDAFRAEPPPGRDSAEKNLESMETKSLVLSIVLAYLYSGREQQAWNTLDEMWPAADRERIANLVVETRAKGILSQTTRSSATQAAPKN
jgi:hypothetical protein